MSFRPISCSFPVGRPRRGKVQIFRGEHVQDLLLELRQAMGRDHFPGRQRHRFDGLTGRLFDGPQHPHLARRDEQNGIARTAGATGAADAMDIGFGVVGDVVIDDVADARHVEPARRHVGGDDDIEAVVPELFDGALAQHLAHVTL